MTIYRLTAEGIDLFTKFIDAVRSGSDESIPSELLGPSSATEVIGGTSEWLDALDVTDKLEAAKQLNAIIDSLNLPSAEYDAGLWSWCSAYLFDRLCKRNSNGKRTPGERAIWVPEPRNWKRYYRHYLASIWRVYQAHQGKEPELRVLLNGPVNTPGELWGQIAATQTLITNTSLIEALSRLYWDEDKNSRKVGAGGKSPRRLTKVLKQFEKTYDFFAMSGNELVDMLPYEFDRFKG